MLDFAGAEKNEDLDYNVNFCKKYNILASVVHFYM